MKNSETYVGAFVEVFGVHPEELNADFSVSRVKKWNSLNHIQLISLLEEKFNIFFDGEDIIEFDSFEKGKEILKKYDIEI